MRRFRARRQEVGQEASREVGGKATKRWIKDALFDVYAAAHLRDLIVESPEGRIPKPRRFIINRRSLLRNLLDLVEYVKDSRHSLLPHCS